MAILNKLGEMAKAAGGMAVDAAKVAGEKAGTALEVGKINLRIRGEEEEIDHIKLALGQLVWERFLNGQNLDEDLAQLCREVRNHQNIIAGLNNQIDSIKEGPAPEAPCAGETEEPAAPVEPEEGDGQ